MRAAGEVANVCVPAPTVGDDFNRPDAAVLGSTSLGAVAWGAAGAGTGGIVSNRAYAITTNTAVTYRLLAGSPTGTFERDVANIGASKVPKLILGYVDGTNHFRITCNGTNWVLHIRTTAVGTEEIDLGVPCADAAHISVTRSTATCSRAGSMAHRCTALLALRMQQERDSDLLARWSTRTRSTTTCSIPRSHRNAGCWRQSIRLLPAPDQRSLDVPRPERGHHLP